MEGWREGKGVKPPPPQQQQQYVGVYARMAPGEVNISVNLKSVNSGNYIQYNPGAGNGYGRRGRGVRIRRERREK
jgi:hypothetical protein